MDNPGTYSLGDITITSAGTYEGEWVEDLDGMLAALVSLRLAWGSGGTAVKAYLQTDLEPLDDGAATVTDIACVVFGAASKHRAVNLSALTPKTTQVTPTDATLTDDTAVDGVLGTKLRLKYVVTGTYAGSTVLSGRVTVR